MVHSSAVLFYVLLYQSKLKTKNEILLEKVVEPYNSFLELFLLWNFENNICIIIVVGLSNKSFSNNDYRLDRISIQHIKTSRNQFFSFLS